MHAINYIYIYVPINNLTQLCCIDNFKFPDPSISCREKEGGGRRGASVGSRTVTI